MAHLVLRFLVQDGRVQLDRAEFEHPLVGRPLRCGRGRYRHLAALEGSFPWSQAVQALCWLVISAKQAKIEGSCKEWSLSGGQGTAAASLDYAISKAPGWVVDMFGVDARGCPILRRLIYRTNPERKRPGPVELRLNSHQLAPEGISISVNGRVMEDIHQLAAVRHSIEAQLKERVEGGSAGLSVKAPEARVPAIVRGPKRLSDQLLQDISRELSFREEWLPMVGAIAQDSRSSLRGTTYDYEVARWWESVSGRAYLYSNVALRKRGVSIKRLFLTTGNCHLSSSALRVAYLQELLGFDVRVACAHVVESRAIGGSAMVSVHDGNFVAVHKPSDSAAKTTVHAKHTAVKELVSWYDEMFEDPAISRRPSAVLKTLQMPAEDVASINLFAARLVSEVESSTPLPLKVLMYD